MVIQVVDSQAIKTTTDELESKSEDQIGSTSEQQPAPRKMTSVIATLSKAKSQNVGSDCLGKQIISIKTETSKSQTNYPTIEMENLKIKTEEVDDDKERDECGELMEKMTKLKLNYKNDSPNVSTRKMVSVLKTRAKQKVKKSDEDDDDENEDEKDRKCKNEILNERGLIKTEHRRKTSHKPYHSQYATIYISDNSSSSRFSPPLQQQIINCVSQVSGNGGTCAVYNVEGQATDSNESKTSPPQKSLHLGSGGIVKYGDNANFSTSPVLTLTTIPDNNSPPNINKWPEQNVSPPIYLYQCTNSNYEQGVFSNLSVSVRSRENSIVESLSPMSTSFCLSPASSQEPFSPASSVPESVLSPNTMNNFYYLDLECGGSNWIAEANDFVKLVSSSLDSDAADELVASIQLDCFPDKDFDCWPSLDLDLTDKFEDIKTSDEDWSVNKNLLLNENATEQTQSMVARDKCRQKPCSQSRSRSNSGKSDVAKKQIEILNNFPKILPKTSDSRTNIIPKAMNILLAENKSARDRLEARLNNRKKTQAFFKVDMKDLRFYQDGDGEGDTNLHIILGNKSTYSDEEVFAVVEKFVFYKAPLDIPNFRGQTPLFCAVMRNDPLIVEYLLEHGADPGYLCVDGITPMHCVAKLGDAYVEVARVLCSKCTPQQLNKKNRDGLTPLHYAVKFCQTKCVGIIEALLTNGAGLAGVEAQASKDGKSALHMAVEKPSLEMVTAICISSRNISSVIDHHMFSRDTALHLAARLNSACNEDVQISIIKMLMKHGAKSVKNKEGKFPKQLVSDKRTKVKYLLTSFKCNLIENL